MPFIISDFPYVMSMSNINPCCFQKINTRRTIGQRRGGVAAGGNQVPPQASVEGVAMTVNPAGLTDSEVRAYLVQMEHAITMQAQSMTDKVKRQNVQRAEWLIG